MNLIIGLSCHPSVDLLSSLSQGEVGWGDIRAEVPQGNRSEVSVQVKALGEEYVVGSSDDVVRTAFLEIVRLYQIR